MWHAFVLLVVDKGTVLGLDAALGAVVVFAWDGFELLCLLLERVEGLWVKLWTELLDWGGAHSLGDGLELVDRCDWLWVDEHGDVRWRWRHSHWLVLQFFIQSFNIIHPKVKLSRVFIRLENELPHLLVVLFLVDLHIFQEPQEPG